MSRVIKTFINSPITFILPGFIGLITFYILPFVILIYYSFVSKIKDGSFVGFNNYIELFNNNVFISSFNNSIIILALCIVFNMTIPLFLSLIINSNKLKQLYILIILIPLAVPSGSVVLFWSMFFDKNGFLNSIINSNINWFESEYSRIIVLIIFLWKNIGYNTILYIAGLNGIKKEYYEIAKIEGAGAITRFFKITLIYLSPTFILTLIMSIVNSFKIFKEIYLITGRYPDKNIFSLQHFINNLFDSLNYQKLSASTVILVFTITLFIQVLIVAERNIEL